MRNKNQTDFRKCFKGIILGSGDLYFGQSEWGYK